MGSEVVGGKLECTDWAGCCRLLHNPLNVDEDSVWNIELELLQVSSSYPFKLKLKLKNDGQKDSRPNSVLRTRCPPFFLSLFSPRF